MPSKTRTSAELVKLWKRQAEFLEQRIQSDLEMLAMLRKRIGSGLPVLLNRPHLIQDLSPVEVVEHFLKQQDAPIAQKRLRDLMYQAGYPMERFGPGCRYFYGILERLRLRGRVFRNGDEVSWLPEIAQRARDDLIYSKNRNQQMSETIRS